MTAERDAAVEAVLLRHQRIPLFDGTQGQRCMGCDDLYGATDGPNSPRQVAHLAAALAHLLAERERAAKAAALLPIRRYAESQALTAKARGRDDRDWLDLLILLDRATEEAR
jgi:hypothetical protein